MNLKYKKLVPEAKEPFRKYNVDAGFDLYAISKEETKKYVEYKTGLAFEIPVGMVGFVVPRSSITKMEMMLKNSIGIIDASYRGEIIFRFKRLNKRQPLSTYENVINYSILDSDIYNIGDRIGQIIFINLPQIDLIESEGLSETTRGTDGWGASGR